MNWLHVAVFVVLAAVIASLGTALYYLATGDGSNKMVRALAIRVALSVVLFVLLMIAWRLGYIRPHGIGG